MCACFIGDARACASEPSVDEHRQKAEVECDSAALVSCPASCEGAARMRVGSQAHPLPSRAARSARTFAFNGTQRTVSSTNHVQHTPSATNARRNRLGPTRSSSMRSDAKSRPLSDFPPAAVWVERHIGKTRFLCMTCIEWVVQPAAAMTWRIR